MYVQHRIPVHRKGFFLWMFIAPLTAPFMIIRAFLFPIPVKSYVAQVVALASSCDTQLTILLLRLEIVVAL